MQDFKLYKDLMKEVDAGNVTVSRMGDLRLFKYSMDCHIQGRWNDVNCQARGLIMKEDGTIVARPIPKFFNLGELISTKMENLPWNESIEVFEKLDGSCGIGYLYNGQWRLATPGSFESDQALFGTVLLNGKIDRCCYVDSLDYLPKNCTPVFEIIYPENRIVVDYKGQTFLALLAIFEHNGEEWHPKRVDQLCDMAGFYRPRRYNIDMKGEIPFTDNEEGYVVRFESGLRIKVKSPAYVRVHRLLNYMSPKGVIDLIRGKEYGVTLLQLPKVIQQDFDDIRAYVTRLYDEIKVRAYDAHNSIPKDLTRKAQAHLIQKNVRREEWGLVFSLLDDKDIKDNIWKLVQQKVKDEKTKVVPID